ncbi:MAG: hypothetical protein WBC04_16825 [Candidatus Acidiferrales bacterium]
MRNFKAVAIGSCLVLASLLFTPHARANEWDKETYVSLSEPVEIPGKILPAGTYMFKLFDTAADRHIVEIYNRNGTELYATVLAIPVEHAPTDKTVITFEERRNGPEAIRDWFYPDDNAGIEFVYGPSHPRE